MTAAAAAAAVVEAGVEAVAPGNRLGGLGWRLVLVQLAHGPDEARGSLGTVDADEDPFTFGSFTDFLNR